MASTLYHQFCAAFQDRQSSVYQLSDNKKIAVACSGGIDSMALANLAITHFGRNYVDILIVDHNLRENSALEAGAVRDYWQSRGAFAEVLTLAKFSGGNKLAWARKRRYQKLSSHCSTQDITLLLVGHHGDDNAENFILRLARKSGIVGLSAMDTTFYLEHALVYRPLLGAFREDLQQYLEENALPYWHDPSNDDENYNRIRARKLFANGYFWNKHAIHQISLALGKIEKQLESALEESIAQVGFVKGGLFIEENAFWGLDRELQRLLLRKMLAFVAEGFPPREKIVQEGLTRLQLRKPHNIGKTNCFVKHNRLWVMKSSTKNPTKNLAKNSAKNLA